MAEQEVRLRLSAYTAELLSDLIWMYGEHIAAGAPIVEMTNVDYERLNIIMRTLNGQIGRNRSYGRPAPDPDTLI